MAGGADGLDAGSRWEGKGDGSGGDDKGPGPAGKPALGSDPEGPRNQPLGKHTFLPGAEIYGAFFLLYTFFFSDRLIFPTI